MPPTATPYILVAGLGRSGAAIARFLKDRGYPVVVTDLDPGYTGTARELEKSGIRAEIGFHSHDTFNHARMIVASPGIPLDMPYLKQAAENGVPIRGELDVAAQEITAPIIAVTGTNGKTTVTRIIQDIMTAAVDTVFTGGNIGTPLADYFETGQDADVVVTEVSSFQLDTAKVFTPRTALLLNIAPDHLDRYPDYAAYADAKWRIFKDQSPEDTAIVGSSLRHQKHRLSAIPSRVFALAHYPDPAPDNGVLIHDAIASFYRQGRWEESVALSGTRLRGAHNIENMAAAALAAWVMDVKMHTIRQVLKAFQGLPHRMEYAGTLNGIPCYNDSKATNPDAVIKAVACFDRVVLIMGGRSKTVDFSTMRTGLTGRVSALILMGEASSRMAQDFKGLCPIHRVADMKDAVSRAGNLAKQGDTILLSPACASFDHYKSYVHRGDDFKRRVREAQS